MLGLEVDEARRRLASAGVRVVAVIETRPPQQVNLVGALRVIRVRRSEEGAVELVVTRERYEPRGRGV